MLGLLLLLGDFDSFIAVYADILAHCEGLSGALLLGLLFRTFLLVESDKRVVIGGGQQCLTTSFSLVADEIVMIDCAIGSCRLLVPLNNQTTFLSYQVLVGLVGSITTCMGKLAYLRVVIHIRWGVLGLRIQISLTFYRLFLCKNGSLLHVLVLYLVGITRFGIVPSLNEVFDVACKVAHTAVELLLLLLLAHQ